MRAAVRAAVRPRILLPSERTMFPSLRKNQRSKPAGGAVCGLHLEQSEAIAAVARLDGGLSVQRAAAADLPLEALRGAGLRPVGLDLSAFALVRALYAPAAQNDSGAVLYAHVAGTTTMAIADGPDCRFTRVSTAGFDTFAAQLAERAEIA